MIKIYLIILVYLYILFIQKNPISYKFLNIKKAFNQR